MRYNTGIVNIIGSLHRSIRSPWLGPRKRTGCCKNPRKVIFLIIPNINLTWPQDLAPTWLPQKLQRKFQRLNSSRTIQDSQSSPRQRTWTPMTLFLLNTTLLKNTKKWNLKIMFIQRRQSRGNLKNKINALDPASTKWCIHGRWARNHKRGFLLIWTRFQKPLHLPFTTNDLYFYWKPN